MLLEAMEGQRIRRKTVANGEGDQGKELWEWGPFHLGRLVPRVPSDSSSHVDQPAHIPGKVDVQSP